MIYLAILSVGLFAWSLWLWTLADARHAELLERLEQVVRQTAPHQPLPPARVQREWGNFSRGSGNHVFMKEFQ